MKGDAEEMERPLSQKANVWGADDEDDAELDETEQLAECSDIQMIRGFSDSESDEEEEAPRDDRARNAAREDGDDKVSAPARRTSLVSNTLVAHSLSREPTTVVCSLYRRF